MRNFNGKLGLAFVCLQQFAIVFAQAKGEWTKLVFLLDNKFLNIFVNITVIAT